MEADVAKTETVDIISRVAINKKDLPLSCPMPSMESWDLHPKIYLEPDTEGQVTCPYCSTQYSLTDI